MLPFHGEPSRAPTSSCCSIVEGAQETSSKFWNGQSVPSLQIQLWTLRRSEGQLVPSPQNALDDEFEVGRINKSLGIFPLEGWDDKSEMNANVSGLCAGELARV